MKKKKKLVISIIIITIMIIIVIMAIFYYKDIKENREYVKMYTAQNQFPAQIKEKKEKLTEVKELTNNKDNICYIVISENTIIEKNEEKISYDELRVGDKIVVYYEDEAVRTVYPTTLYEITRIKVLK